MYTPVGGPPRLPPHSAAEDLNIYICKYMYIFICTHI